jgi:hypothetical protein
MEGTHNNDNSDPWTTLSAATERVIDQLEPHKQQREDRGGNRETSDRSEQEQKDHGDYVATRLREWRAWERRISGKG